MDLAKPPKGQRPSDIVTVEETRRLIEATRMLSYRVFFFTLYSLGLRLGEGLALTVADSDAARRRVHIRAGKGNKDRFVPLPAVTLQLLRRFRRLHRNRVLLFPHRAGGREAADCASTPLDRGGVQLALRKVVAACGLKNDHAP
jgi:integrase